nr:chemotaxis protein CheY [Aeromicrobium marinum]
MVSEHPTLRVLVYSDDRDVRSAVVAALGRHPHPDLPAFEYLECATEPVVFGHLDDRRPAHRVDLVILDGEATPAGGLGIARQIKDEIFRAAPVLVITGRPQDAWLATWSRADAVVTHPIQPLRLAEAVIGLARGVLAAG